MQPGAPPTLLALPTLPPRFALRRTKARSRASISNHPESRESLHRQNSRKSAPPRVLDTLPERRFPNRLNAPGAV